MSKERHWIKLDHVTFLFAFVLVGLNIALNLREISIAAFILMLIALIYDILE
jgi:hypothetical protein